MTAENPLAEHYADERLEFARWLCVKAAHEGLVSWDSAVAVFALALARNDVAPDESHSAD